MSGIYRGSGMTQRSKSERIAQGVYLFGCAAGGLLVYFGVVALFAALTVASPPNMGVTGLGFVGVGLAIWGVGGVIRYVLSSKEEIAMKPRNPQRPKSLGAPTEYQRFLDMAREVEADESPGAMDRAFEKVIPMPSKRRGLSTTAQQPGSTRRQED